MLRSAVALKEEDLGPDHPDVAISLSGLGTTLDELGQDDEALPVMNQAIAIYREKSDPDSFQMGAALLSRADALLNTGDHTAAQRDVERALDILGRTAGATHPDLAEATRILGDCAVGRGHARTAIPLFEQAIAADKTSPSYEWQLADARFGLAKALWETGLCDQRSPIEHHEPECMSRRGHPPDGIRDTFATSSM
jgi:tetratricopeptide (TPR) repeat protein